MTVGVRELKANLSKCLRRVQAGEQLTITDRGRAIATIAPIQTSANVDWAYRLVAGGGAHWGGGKPAGLPARIPARGMPASAMVLEDRR